MTILDQSLCMLQGVSPEAEIRLLRGGVLTCEQLATEADRYFSPRHAKRIRESYAEWKIACSHSMVDWIVGHLPPGLRVRALAAYMDDALFYDIETDGTTSSGCITCISTLRKGEVRSFWEGHNMADFLIEWAKAKIVVSFNGKRFDSPIVAKAFGLAALPAQIDLMDEAAHYGYRGGLKIVEKHFGFNRKTKECSNGKDAIRLWAEYIATREQASLDTLLAYNREDVLALPVVAKGILRLSLANTIIDL